jgi:hypothetical protein
MARCSPTIPRSWWAARVTTVIGAPLLVVPVRRTSSFLEADYDFTDSVKGSFEFSYGRVEADGRGAQTRDTSAGSVITIHGDNPYLPAGVRSARARVAADERAGILAASSGQRPIGKGAGSWCSITTRFRRCGPTYSTQITSALPTATGSRSCPIHPIGHRRPAVPSWWSRPIRMTRPSARAA